MGTALCGRQANKIMVPHWDVQRAQGQPALLTALGFSEPLPSVVTGSPRCRAYTCTPGVVPQPTQQAGLPSARPLFQLAHG